LNDGGDEVPYCQRWKGSEELQRNRTRCELGAEQITFHELIERRIEPREVLLWSSSIEVADIYARLFNNFSSIEENVDKFACRCNETGTFGKFCEYRLGGGQTHFRQAVDATFKKRTKNDSWNTQRYGKILCYETLPCNTGPLCLDWREICDGVQRCSNGIDEENCDKLEFNECENDEFRCTNGMCISVEFWLDGSFLVAFRTSHCFYF
jgi:hypothetical protein